VLDETPPNCKPGLGSQVEILMDRRHQVIAVPLTSLYSQGNQTFVFVKEQGREYPKPVEVKVGATNDTYAELTSGLNAGQDVLLLQPSQGRMLLEKAGIKIAPTTRPGDTGAPKRPRRTVNASAAPVHSDASSKVVEKPAKGDRGPRPVRESASIAPTNPPPN
jgi:hypothetical protein